jgi:hypothetical protein
MGLSFTLIPFVVIPSSSISCSLNLSIIKA